MASNARFHNKWHRRNHHSAPTSGYPDSASDPIASASEPFGGEIVLTDYLSAHGNAYIDGDTTILGSLSVYGDLSYFDTYVSVTSSLSVVNHGSGPAATVEQYGSEPIARFIDGDAEGESSVALAIEDNGYIVINGIEPAVKFDVATQQDDTTMRLTVNGSVYSKQSVIYETPMANTIYVSTTGSDINSGLNPSQKVKTIKKAAQIAFDDYGPNKCTIIVEAGDYTENNPIYIVAGTSIIGEGFLRRTIVRPYNKQLDMFWLNNGCYMWGFTFRDHLAPSAATAFPNLLSATPAYQIAFNTPGYEINTTKPGGPFGFPIVSKPYITTSPYTQGMSSITRSLTVPIQPDLYPNYFSEGTQAFYDFNESQNISTLIHVITDTLSSNSVPSPLPTLLPQTTYTNTVTSVLNTRKSTIQDRTVSFVNGNSPPENYDEAKCRRDVGYIVDALINGLNTTSALPASAAGLAYLNGAIPSTQVDASIRAFQYVRDIAVDYIQPGALEAANAVKSFDIISSIIKNKGTAPSPVTTIPTEGADVALYLLNNNKEFIQDATVKYVDYNYPTLVYDKLLCKRDVGYIINAVINDINNNTTENAINAGLGYFNYLGESYLPDREVDQTLAAIEFAKTTTLDILSNRKLLTYDQKFNNALTQSYETSAYIAGTFGTLIGILRTGAIPGPSTFTPTTSHQQAAQLLLLNKPFIQKTTINYVDKTFPGFAYNRATCERDAGLIIECLATDLQQGTNANMILAGSRYYRNGRSVIVGQEAQTIAAINYMSYLAQSAVTNTIAITGQSINPYLSSGIYSLDDLNRSFDIVNRLILTKEVPGVTIESPQYFDPSKSNGDTCAEFVANAFSTINLIISGGLTVAPSVTPISSPAGTAAATALLSNNRTFLQEEVIKYVNKRFPKLKYSQTLCYRDAGYIVDAVVSDLTNGTNQAAILAGSSYWNGTQSKIKGQEFQTIEALRYMELMAQRVITNTLIDKKNNAVEALRANKVFIQKEVIQYMKKAYPRFEYNETLCERDVGYIINAVVEDITYSNTNASIAAGSAYLNGAITGQEIQTVAAINYAKYLAQFIIQNMPVENIDAGCGIRVDGELALGFTRSFVTDSFTQYNQGGKGIHVINCGYAQLVSTFTICTTEGVMTETGGQCSISTSNCSFGLSGLVATGKSKFPVLTGYQYETTPLSENYIVLQDVTPRPLSAFIAALQAGYELQGIPVEAPYNGLLVSVENDPASNYDALLNPSALQKYHGIKSVSALPTPYPPYSYKLTLERNVTAPLTASQVEPKYVELYLRSQIASSSHAFEYIGTGIELEKAVPALGGIPINDNEAVYSDNGIVYYSSTNERGDFKVGRGFKIKQEKGVVEGLDFNKSILALVTPLILTIA